MWNVTLEYTTTDCTVRSGNPSQTFYTQANAQLYDTDMVVVSWKLGRKCSHPWPPGLEPETCGVRIHHPIRSPTAAFGDIIISCTEVL